MNQRGSPRVSGGCVPALIILKTARWDSAEDYPLDSPPCLGLNRPNRKDATLVIMVICAGQHRVVRIEVNAGV